VTENIYST